MAEPSDSAAPVEGGLDAADPFDALEGVVRHLGDELAFFRRRALEAERRLRDALAVSAPTPARKLRDPDDVARIAALELENAQLRARLVDAAERARAVANRLRFARQQDDAAAAEAVLEGGAGRAG